MGGWHGRRESSRPSATQNLPTQTLPSGLTEWRCSLALLVYRNSSTTRKASAGTVLSTTGLGTPGPGLSSEVAGRSCTYTPASTGGQTPPAVLDRPQSEHHCGREGQRTRKKRLGVLCNPRLCLCPLGLCFLICHIRGSPSSKVWVTQAWF